MVAVELAVSADQIPTVVAVDPFLMLMLLAEVLEMPRTGLHGLVREQSKVLGEACDVAVGNTIDGVASGALDLVVVVERSQRGGAWIASGCGPLTASVAHVEDHLLKIILILSWVQQTVQTL